MGFWNKYKEKQREQKIRESREQKIRESNAPAPLSDADRAAGYDVRSAGAGKYPRRTFKTEEGRDYLTSYYEIRPVDVGKSYTWTGCGDDKAIITNINTRQIRVDNIGGKSVGKSYVKDLKGTETITDGSHWYRGQD